MSVFDSRRGSVIPFAASSTGDQLPATCPACQSSAIVTTAKTPDSNSYWRCTKCGEVWNASRSIRRAWSNDLRRR